MFALKASKNIVAVLVIFLFSLQLFAQSNNRDDIPISEEFYEILKKRKELIEQEVASGKNEWSGTYSLGDHHPTIFMWSAGQGFLTWGSHHTFFPSRINFGKTELLNNRLFIKPEINKEHLNFQQVPTELVLVRWGEQHFLIGADELTDFAYAVHSGAETQIVDYFAKSEDYEKPRKGLPDLPLEYRKIMIMRAIKPVVTAFKVGGGDTIYDDEITLSRGSADKVVKGMVFYHVNSTGSLTIMVTDLQEKSSKAKIIGVSSSSDKGAPEPKVGLKFTSRAPKGFLGY